MGAKFWTAAEDNYFWFTALPLSNYATGVNVKNSGLNWRELAVRMQIDLDAQNLSERQYAGPMLFQQWSRRFSALAEARGEASPLYLAGKAEREVAHGDGDNDGDDEDSLSSIKSPASYNQEDENGEVVFLSPSEEEDDDEEEEVEQDESQFSNVPAHLKSAPVTPTNDRYVVKTPGTLNTNGKSVEEDSDIDEDEYQYQVIYNSTALNNAVSIPHQMQILPSSTKTSGNQRLLSNDKQVAQDSDVSMEDEVDDDQNEDTYDPSHGKSAQVAPRHQKDTSMTSSQKRKGKGKQVAQVSDEEDAYPFAISPAGPGNSKNKKQRL